MRGPAPVSDARVDAVLARARAADAHADSLLWNRDLNARSDKGHVDFARLAEIGAGLQCFTVVTRGFPVVDGFGAFARWAKWPREAARGRWARAMWQIDQLERFCAASAGRAIIARTRVDLDMCEREGRLAAVLGVEGGHALEGEVARVAELYARGVRFMSLTHLAGNELAGGSFPVGRRSGLTPLGREVLAEMARLGMAVDLSHASRRTVDEILAESGAPPVFCSHTGIASVTPSWRNLDDAALRAIAARGGVVGVIFATNFIGGSRLENLVAQIERAVEVAGEDHVGFGSDYDGFIRLPRPMRDVTGVRALVGALLEHGMSEAVVEKVAGRNLWRFFAERVMPAS